MIEIIFDIDEKRTSEFSPLRTMEKWNFLRSNNKKCTQCNKDQRLLSFHINDTIYDQCRDCQRKLEKEIQSKVIAELLKDM